eukprot:SAG31_NODE_8128_length_1516_cov_1.755822_2_plen_50_part_01
MYQVQSVSYYIGRPVGSAWPVGAGEYLISARYVGAVSLSCSRCADAADHG